MSLLCTCVLCNRQNTAITCTNCFLCTRNETQFDLLTSVFEGEFDVNSKYYTPDDFYEHSKNINTLDTLTLLHFNCRSLKRNFDNFSECVQTLNMPMSIIGVTETWLKNYEMDLSLPSYSFVGNARRGRRGGGVGIFVHNNIKFKRRCDLDICNDVVESIFIEVYNKMKNYIIAVIYRPPQQSVQSFIDTIQSPLSVISTERKESILLGDFNVDLMKFNITPHVNDFIDNFNSYSYLPQIFKPTRITSHSASILDNIFYNYPEKVQHNGIILTDVSDHLTPFIMIPFHCNLNDSYMEFLKRDINDDNIHAFCSKLQLVDWEILNDIHDVDQKYYRFIEIYTQQYNECFPEIKVRKKKLPSVKPWLTNEIKKMCKRKYILYRKYLKNPSDYRKNVYKQYRNRTNNMLRDAKRKYYDVKFRDALNNARTTWKVINEILNKNKDKVLIDEIEFEGKSIKNKTEICNLFNDYFSAVGQKNP